MGKSIITQAAVIRIKPLGENNVSVCFFTQTHGIIYAVMYGGRKSRLRSLVSPWNSGTAYFSESSKQGSFFKIYDFDVKNYHLSFRENLLKMYSACLAAELIIKTNAAGNSKICWQLLNGFIDGLDRCKNDFQCRLGLIRFLWRFLELMGVQPDVLSCAVCGNSFFTGKSCCDTLSYIPSENGFVCRNCRPEKSAFLINLQILSYLSSIKLLSPVRQNPNPLTESDAANLKHLIFYLIENASGLYLNSLKIGENIL